ncbi:MAG: hypothetical protein KME35_18100 [Aphanocapsa sp. GSE-SYN-MK-11-07L]|jgi:hypothetical protein|nr:hypothetical protein [Aphanocapsa sp. GSE-SYN-MK-11-07L]
MGIKVKAAICAGVMLACFSGISEAMANPRRVDPDSLPLKSVSFPQQIDSVSDFNRYWVDDTIGGGAMFIFGAPTFNDIRLTRAGQRIERFYQDVLRQQGDSPIVRTRDLESPFCESLQGTPACSVVVQAPPPPAPQPFIPAPPPPAPVPALY